MPTAANPPPPDGSTAPARKRRGLPILPTIMVAIAFPTLLGFGVWQLQRMQWKAEMLERVARNSALPVTAIDLNAAPEAMLFRRVEVEISCLAKPQERAGRNLAGQSGYSVIFPLCTAREAGKSSGLTMAVNAGWSPRAGGSAGVALPSGAVTGVVVPTKAGRLQGLGLVLDSAPPPLVPSAPPGIDTISNNHFSYAVQWFSFAAILAVIYAVYVRRWRTGAVARQQAAG